MSNLISANESQVRSYSRDFPATFSTASGPWLTDTGGARYLDLLMSAGSLNYGHNNPELMDPVIAYLRAGGITNSLDLFTVAKEKFMECFIEYILKPRNLSYKLQFPGPTGANAIEAALKLARKVTGRNNIVTFSHAYHGVTIGTLAVTANPSKRNTAGSPLYGATFMPYDGFFGSTIDTLDYIIPMLTRPGSGIDRPAAILVEMVQGEGGLAAAGKAWINGLANLAARLGALLIVDDIQAGCGRTGSFFSFEGYEISPDIVVLSKSLSGIGTPFSLVAIKPEYDLWLPGEHNGTFRGNNLGYIGGAAAIETYWRDPGFVGLIRDRSLTLARGLHRLANMAGAERVKVVGRGLMMGLSFAAADKAALASRLLYERKIIAETCGENLCVLKFLPPITIDESTLEYALEHIGSVIRDVLP